MLQVKPFIQFILNLWSENLNMTIFEKGLNQFTVRCINDCKTCDRVKPLVRGFLNLVTYDLKGPI